MCMVLCVIVLESVVGACRRVVLPLVHASAWDLPSGAFVSVGPPSRSVWARGLSSGRMTTCVTPSGHVATRGSPLGVCQQ